MPEEELKRRQIYESIINPGGFYGTAGRLTPFDDWRNAGIKLDRLKQLNNDNLIADNDYYNTLKGGFKADRAAAGMQMGLSALNGISSLVGQNRSLAKINDTQWYDNQLADIEDRSRNGYSNYAQLSNELASTSYTPHISYKDVRGMSEAQELGGIASSIASGASAGSAFGPYGTLFGGIAGGLIGAGGVVNGRRDARINTLGANNNALLATNAALANNTATHRRIGESENRNSQVNAGANGGQISRPQLTAREFADKMLGNSEVKSNKSITVIRENGGTKVRIKR